VRSRGAHVNGAPPPLPSMSMKLYLTWKPRTRCSSALSMIGARCVSIIDHASSYRGAGGACQASLWRNSPVYLDGQFARSATSRLFLIACHTWDTLGAVAAGWGPLSSRDPVTTCSRLDRSPLSSARISTPWPICSSRSTRGLRQPLARWEGVDG
jgi:hypothetical protein